MCVTAMVAGTNETLNAKCGECGACNDLKIDEPAKSSQVKTILADLGLNTALIVLSSSNDNLNKASKNLTQCKVQTISSIDPSALIQAEKVVVTSDTLEKLTEVLS